MVELRDVEHPMPSDCSAKRDALLVTLILPVLLLAIPQSQAGQVM